MKTSRSSALDQFISRLFATGTTGLHAIVFLVLVCATGSAHASKKTITLSKSDKISIEGMLTAELQQTINQQRRIDGQPRNLAVKVRLDEDSSGITLVIDLGKGYIPKNARYFGAEMEELTGELATTASELVRDIIPIVGIIFLYEGRDIYEHFPDEHSLTDSSGVNPDPVMFDVTCKVEATASRIQPSSSTSNFNQKNR